MCVLKGGNIGCLAILSQLNLYLLIRVSYEEVPCQKFGMSPCFITPTQIAENSGSFSLLQQQVMKTGRRLQFTSLQLYKDV